MVKVPATDAGYEAMTILLSMGISVNATLVFSPKQAQRCLKAMQKGIDEFEQHHKGKIDTVISVFVSRFDRLLDNDLLAEGLEVSKTGIYNAAKIYNLVEACNKPNIRTLFASTGVKGDDLAADYYMRELLAPHSVNTAPLGTIEEYISTTASKPKLPLDEDEIKGYFIKLSDNGFDMDRVYKQLLNEGLEAFEKAFQVMLDNL